MSSLPKIVVQTLRVHANKGLSAERCFLTLRKVFYLKQSHFSTSGRKMSSYITDKAFINGTWTNAKNTFAVQNPFSNENIGSSADCDTGLAEEAIQAAVAAFDKWTNLTAKARSDILRKWGALVTAEKEALAKLLTLENGKPLAQSVGEIAYAVGFIDWYAEEGRRTYGATIPSPSPAKKMMTIKQAIGVTAMITPWNFPSAMITRKACAALAAGCTVVLKPSEETPFSALALAQLAEKAGMPPGVFNVIPTSRTNVSEVGKLLCTHPSIAAVSFTGSTATGKILLRQAADTVKKMSLELGGLAPLLVFNSADIKNAVEGTMASKFRYSGQTCVCANRILVQSGIHDEFVSKLKEAVEKELIMGDGLDSKTTLGPLINDAAVLKVESQVQNAISKGAKIVTGGSRGNLGKNFFQPTVMTGITPDMECCKLETFGPLAPIIKFNTEEEALAIANASTYGLAGYLFSGNVSQCWRVAEKLETGIVGINEGLMSAPEAPFGGYKESGLGREGSFYGVDEFMEVKYLCWGVSSK